MNSGFGVVVEGERFYYNAWLGSREKHFKKYFQHISFIATKNPVFHLANIYWYLPCAKYCAQFCKDTKMNMIEFLPCRNSPFNNGNNYYSMEYIGA